MLLTTSDMQPADGARRECVRGCDPAFRRSEATLQNGHTTAVDPPSRMGRQSTSSSGPGQRPKLWWPGRTWALARPV